MDVANLLSSTSVSSNTSTTSYPLTELQESMLDFLQRSFLSSYHHNLAIIQIESERFLLGIQLAKLLRRETSNLYRSLKRARIPLVRASSDQVRWINSLNLCFVQKTHSITFIPLRETIDYLTEGCFSGEECSHLLQNSAVANRPNQRLHIRQIAPRF